MINTYILFFLVSVFISSCAQIMLKTSANKEYGSILKEYLNPRVVGAYTVFFAASLCTIYAYKGVPLSMGPILESTQYIFVALLSYFILKEKISRRKMIGFVIIITGMLICAV